MFKYSIIVAVYNLENYIEESLNSILQQTYQSIEIIVIDDGSTDKSTEICQTIAQKDNRVKIFNNRHGGVSSARNTGIVNATGDYIFFVDGDDFIETDYIEKADRILSKSDVDIMITNHYYCYENKTGKCTDKEMFPMVNTNSKKNFSLLDYILDNNYLLPCYACFNIYKREFLIDNKCFFTQNIKWSEDLDFFLQVILQHPTYEVSNIKYYYYRRHREGSSAADVTTDKILDKQYILRKWVLNLNHYEPVRTRQLLCKWLAREYYLTFPFCLPWYSSNIDYKCIAEKIDADSFIWEKYYPHLGSMIKRIGLRNAVVLLKIKEYSKVILKNLLWKN